MVLPLTGGSHEGSRVHRRQEVYKQKAEHSRAVHCNATASGPLRGGDAARRVEGKNEVVGTEGNRLGEGKSEGIGDGIGVRIGDRHVKGGDAGRRKKGKRIEWGGMEQSKCIQFVINANYFIYYLRTEYSDWVAVVLGLEKPPNNEQAIWSW